MRRVGGGGSRTGKRKQRHVSCQNIKFTVFDADKDDFMFYTLNDINNLQPCRLPSAHSAQQHTYQLG